MAITVGGANDAPVATDDVASTPEDTLVGIAAVDLAANDTDAENQTLTVTAVGNPTHGIVALVGGVATFIPEANYSGAATFEYTVSDGVATDTGVVAITVTAVNDLPIAADDSAATAEDTVLQLTSSALTTNDTDVDGPSLAVSAVTSPTNGTVALVAGIATFTPAANYSGPAGFDYTVSDGTATDTGHVTITVNAVNDPPVAVDDGTSTSEDNTMTVLAASLLANDTDIDGAALTLTGVSNPTNGTVTFDGTLVRFTPPANFNGTGTFTYTVSDGTAIDTAVVTVIVISVSDPPVAVDDVAAVQADTPLELAHAALLANDLEVDNHALSIAAVQNPVNGTVELGATTVTFTPDAGFAGTASFDYVLSNTVATDVGTVVITVTAGPICGDGTIASPEACDDGNPGPGDGCGATCLVESGWSCSGEPSTCVTVCNDGIVAGDEACDDGDADDTNGCTTQCIEGALCTAAALPGGDRFAVDPASGHCYASFDGELTTFAAAQTACAASGGYLVTITSAAEQGFAHGVQNVAENPWIGATDDANDTDAVFDWVTDEAFGFAAFAPGQPDDDAAFGGNGECLHLVDADGLWNDTNCTISSFVVGRICEVEPEACGDSIRQTAAGEECDDGNTESDDGCSATCKRERLATFSFTGALGNEVTLAADGAAPVTGLASLPAIARGPGITASAAGNTFSASAFTLAASVDANDYFKVTVVPAVGFTASVTALELDERRSLTGVRNGAVRSSLDNFTADIATFAIPDNDLTRTQVIPLPAAFSGLAAPLELRIYGFAAEANGGTWRLDNIKLFGFTDTP